jgi:hypothetical protein
MGRERTSYLHHPPNPTLTHQHRPKGVKMSKRNQQDRDDYEKRAAKLRKDVKEAGSLMDVLKARRLAETQAMLDKQAEEGY